MDHNLQKAIQLHNQGDLLGAIALYRDLVDAEPENADAWHLFGVAAYQHGSPDLGADLIGNAIELKPGVADYHSNLAMVQKAMGRLADSEASLDKALACNPTHAKALSNLAGLKRMAGEFEATVDLARRAVAANGDDAETHNNLGNALKDMGRPVDAIASYRRAVEIAPDFALAHWNLSLVLLLTGDLPGGFSEMSWRWRWSGFPAPRRGFQEPLWDGKELGGKKILLHAEQGLGDALHFVRYAEPVRELGGEVILEVPEAMMPLVRQAGLAETVIAQGAALPGFDCHASFLDLPRLLASDFGNLP
ncbi:MAG: tetratricopeptide repeat protein, partial [Rhodospirillales bacterium]|nr:tetratricopeptide repeat protein [Rhodospirillales bacterium]